MGNYASMDASIKIIADGSWHSTKRDTRGNKKSGTGGIKGWINHVCRDVSMRNDEDVEHSNECIDLDRTPDNETYCLNADGKMMRCKKTKEFYEAFERRLNDVTKTVRRDAVVARPIVTQVVGEAYQDERKFISDLYSFMVKHYGHDNVVGLSVHRDETNMHIHWLVVPVVDEVRRKPLKDENGNFILTKKGNKKYGDPEPTGKKSLNQKQFFPSREDMSNLHKEFRQYLREHGVNVELENKPLEDVNAVYMDKDGKARQVGLSIPALKEISVAKELASRSLESALGKEQQATQDLYRLREREVAIQAREAAFYDFCNNKFIELEKRENEAARSIERGDKKFAIAEKYLQRVDGFINEVENVRPTLAKQLREQLSSASPVGRQVRQLSNADLQYVRDVEERARNSRSYDGEFLL